MNEYSVIRQITGKGNGQAIIGVTQQNLKDLDCGVDDYVKLIKVKRKVIITKVNRSVKIQEVKK